MWVSLFLSSLDEQGFLSHQCWYNVSHQKCFEICQHKLPSWPLKILPYFTYLRYGKTLPAHSNIFFPLFMLIVIQIFKFCLDKTRRNRSRWYIFYIMFLNSSNQLNVLVTITFCEKISMKTSFFQHFWHILKFSQLSSSFFQFCVDKTGRNRPKVIDFLHHVIRQYQSTKCI